MHETEINDYMNHHVLINFQILHKELIELC